MAVDRDLLIAAGRIGGRMLIGALGGILNEADALTKSASAETQRRIARAKAKLEQMRRREAATPRDVDDDGNPYGV